MSPPVQESTQSPPAAPALHQDIAGRYGVTRRLGRGGMGTVYLVEDRRRDNRPCALKRVRHDRLDARTIATLRTEFLTLSWLRHPNIIRAYDFGIDPTSGDLFFTAELVEGESWMRKVKGLDLASRPDLELFLDLTVQVLRSLAFIHHQGLVHRDIKPDNVLVGDAGKDSPYPSGRIAKMIDFGLAGRENDAFAGKKIFGTPLYVAPETILGAPADRRTDLYSFGVVLYHLAVGQPPFHADSNLKVLKSHVRKAPVPPHQRNPAVPEALSEIILRLMAKKPAERYAGCTEVIEKLNHRFGFDFALETTETIESYLDSARIAVREWELRRSQSVLYTALGVQASEEFDGFPRFGDTDDLDATVGRTPLPSGRMLLVRGGSGQGKTRLLESLRSLAQAQQATLLRAECLEHDEGTGGSLYQLIREARASGLFDGKKDDDSRLNKLRRFERGARGRVRSRAMDQLKQFATELLAKSQEYRIVVELDRLHSAGPLTLELVRTLLHASLSDEAQDCKFLLIATALDRPEFANPGFVRLRDSVIFRNGVLDVGIEALDEVSLGSFLQHAFAGSTMPEEFVQRLLEESDGNLDILVEVIMYYVNRGALRREEQGWRVVGRIADDNVSGTVRRRLRERIQKLPPDAMEMALASACLGRPCQLELISRIVEFTTDRAAAAVEHLKDEKILSERIHRYARELYFVHSTTKRVFDQMLSGSRRRAFHARAGAVFEEFFAARGQRPVTDLAFHYLEAGDRDRGVRYGLEAAKIYQHELQPHQALKVYRRIADLLPEEQAESMREVLLGMSELCIEVGDFRTVVDLLKVPEGATLAARWGENGIEICVQLVRAYARLGEFHQAESVLKELLQLNLASRPLNEIMAFTLACAELSYLRGNPIESLRYCQRLIDVSADAGDEKFRCELYLLTAENCAVLRDLTSAAEHCQLALRLVEKRKDGQLAPLSYFARGKYYTYTRHYEEAIRQFQFCLSIHRRMRSLAGEGKSLLAIGELQHALGRTRSASQMLERARTLFHRLGYRPAWVNAGVPAADLYRRSGRYAGMKEVLTTIMDKPAARGRNIDVRVEGLLVCAAAQLDFGALEESGLQLQKAASLARWATGGDVFVKILSLRSDLALHQGRFGAAVRRAEDGLIAARELDDPVLTARLLAQLAYLFARLGLRGEAHAQITALVDLSGQYGLDLAAGWARLVEGIVLGADGVLDLAERSFQRSLELLGRLGAERDLAELRLELGLLHLKQANFEQAYLNLEEGEHAARRLRLHYVSCRYGLAKSLLDFSLQELPASQLEAGLAPTITAVQRGPYPEFLWRVYYQQARIQVERGHYRRAQSSLRMARVSYEQILREIPLEYKGAYRGREGARAFEAMMTEFGLTAGNSS